MKSKISIIVPVYNGEKSIERCISSICNQTYADIEVIIVNDGSTDRTREMCEQMCKQDRRIKLFNIQNGGVANARNYGIDHSTGEYIMFVDADDYIEKEMCEVLQKKMCQYNVELVVSKAVDEDVCGNVIARPKVSKSGIIQFDEEFSFVEDYACFVSWGCLYKRDILDGIRFDSRFYVGEDSLFFYMVVNNLVLGYNYGHEMLNNLYLIKRSSTQWLKIKNLIHQNLSSRLLICTAKLAKA